MQLKPYEPRKRTCYDAPLFIKEGGVIQVEVISTPLRDGDGTVTGVVDAITVGDDGESRAAPTDKTGDAS
ncbi:MAG TPA: hypothetical protein EYQ64_08415 [Gemmatimonadetes bacterium]|nr:hypothetical protein [Gemmatimonadota bacterium]